MKLLSITCLFALLVGQINAAPPMSLMCYSAPNKQNSFTAVDLPLGCLNFDSNVRNHLRSFEFLFPEPPVFYCVTFFEQENCQYGRKQQLFDSSKPQKYNFEPEGFRGVASVKVAPFKANGVR
ncbi:hypothetical protein K7432_017413 [Basidiobolus ranarum]|uniref:Uncharacterized protein n=1 Tax=Basidiobolus ranarum TaxID=34480 RepID=A0ABR2WDE3_9FUNG